jgi:F-type H+-transporting ATPase subunit b
MRFRPQIPLRLAATRSVAVAALCAMLLMALAPAARAQGGGGQSGGGGKPQAEQKSSSSGSSSKSSSSSGESSSGSFLVSPSLGLMIWTLALFLFTMYVLKKLAFPRIAEALDRRQKAITESIEAAQRQREEADELLREYRQRLTEAREQADDITKRARKAAEAAVAEASAEGKTKREELVAAARRDIEAETRRSLDRIRKEVADLTVLATERVTRKALDSKDHKRLIDDALAEVDFSALAGEAKANGGGD